MSEKMVKGTRYLIDHPLFDDVWLFDYFLYPQGMGFIGQNGVGPRSSGVLHLSGDKIPRHLDRKISIRGLVATFPNGAEHAIYPANSERPSSKAKREQLLAEMISKRDADIDEVIRLISHDLPCELADEHRKDLVQCIHDFEFSPNARSASDYLKGVCRGLSLHGAAPKERIQELLKRIGDLRRHGEELALVRRSSGSR